MQMSVSVSMLGISHSNLTKKYALAMPNIPQKDTEDMIL